MASARSRVSATRLQRWLRVGVLLGASSRLPWLADTAQAYGSTLMEGGEDLPTDGTVDAPGDDASAAAVWVPARNLVLLSVASAHAETVGAHAVVVGFNREEAVTFPDNSPEFVAGFNAALKHAARTPLRLEVPTIDLDKRQIVALARSAGLGPQDVWSCYSGDASPCGCCESCVRSARAWAPE